MYTKGKEQWSNESTHITHLRRNSIANDFTASSPRGSCVSQNLYRIYSYLSRLRLELITRGRDDRKNKKACSNVSRSKKKKKVGKPRKCISKRVFSKVFALRNLYATSYNHLSLLSTSLHYQFSLDLASSFFPSSCPLHIQCPFRPCCVLLYLAQGKKINAHQLAQYIALLIASAYLCE